MTELVPIKKVHNEIVAMKEVFESMGTNLDFQRECQFALFAMEKNDYLLKIALQNPKSLRSAIANVSAIGLSLNSAERLAYLVPMDGAVQLQVSYIGLSKLAVLDGGVMWVQANVVRKKDTFVLNGYGAEPTHLYNAFDNDRGEVVGVYCVARTSDRSFLVTTMTLDECLSIRDRTQIWQKSKSGPWKSDPEEMMKKTVIKRASKTWPRGKTTYLDTAIEVINQHEGIDFESEKKLKKVSNESTLLNNALTPKTITEDRTKHNEVIANIFSLCKVACSGFGEEEKKVFMENELKMTTKEIKEATMEDLLNLEAFLLERYGDLKWED